MKEVLKLLQLHDKQRPHIGCAPRDSSYIKQALSQTQLRGLTPGTSALSYLVSVPPLSL